MNSSKQSSIQESELQFERVVSICGPNLMDFFFLHKCNGEFNSEQHMDDVNKSRVLTTGRQAAEVTVLSE